jgi:hypothetical protein
VSVVEEKRGRGRPKGSKDWSATQAQELISEYARKTLQLPEHVCAMSPLSVMVTAMYLAVDDNNWKAAATYAEKAAPYVHAKLSSVDVNATVRKSLHDLSDEELIALAGDGEGEDGGVAEEGSEE